MELENTQNNALAKLPMLKLGEEWEFMGTIKARFGGNEATKKTQKALLKQRYHQEELYIHKEEMAPMALSDSKVNNDKSCSKTCLTNYEALKKQYDDLLVKLDDTGFKAATYKRGLATLQEQIIKYREHEVLFSEEIALLKRSVGHKEYQMGLLSQITDKSKKGFGYNAVPSPHPLILNRPTPLDLSYSGLEEFKQPEVNEYGPRDSSLKPTIGCDKESNNSKENTDDSLEQHQKTDTETSSVKSSLKVDKDWKEKFFCPANHVREVELKKVRENNDAPIIEDWVSDDEDDDEPNPKVEKKTVIPTATKKEFVKPEKPVRRSVRYAEMYRSQRPRGNQRNWNGQKSNQLGCNFVFNNKACFICGSFDHIQYSCPNQQRKRIVSGNNYNKKDNDYYSKTSHSSAHKHMAPRAVLMKTGLKSVNTTRHVNIVRSVNTGRPFSTASYYYWFKITAVDEKVNAAESLLVVSTEDAQATKILKLKIRIKKLEKKCKPSISHHKAWLKSVKRLSMKKRLGKKESVSKQGRKNVKPGPTLDAFDDLDDDLVHGVSTVVNNSTANRPDVSTTTPMTPPTTTNVFEDEDIFLADALVMLSDKAKLKGVEIKEMKDAERPARSDPDEAQIERDAKITLKVQAKLDKEARLERQRQEQSSLNYIANLYDEVQARIDADHKLAVRWTQKEHEKYIMDERAKLLAEYFENRKKQLAEERATAIRNKPPTRSQLGSIMITYLKHIGRYKHAQMNKKTLEEIHVLYIKEQERSANFVAIVSEEDERLIQKMNKKVAGVHEEKVLEEPNSTKVEVKQEGHKESTRKRLGRRLKMKATKKSKMQKTDSDLEEEKHLKTFLRLVPDEEGIINYEVLEKRFPIINWESKLYHLDRNGAKCIYYRIFRSDGSSR
ncbi:hypothetical protein Tco_1114666 [Tanacetum coccineum]|uniref:CCHC-type domain-containing protein n=1 Tax=Tanacetum coccineum TaxID=301880 RepID=A0ABQ5IVT6_9ASTR